MRRSTLHNIAALFLLLLLAVSSVAQARPPKPLQSDEKCASPFGKSCGSVVTRQYITEGKQQGDVDDAAKKVRRVQSSTPDPRVVAYSNCNGAYLSGLSNYVPVAEILSGFASTCDITSECPPKVYSGEIYQCVEFGRRYSLYRYGAHFAGVEYAVDIFALQNISRLAIEQTPATPAARRGDGGSSSSSACKCVPKSVPFLSIRNNRTETVPQEGDLIIYDTHGPGMALTGHVCVVVNVTMPVPTPDGGGGVGKILIAEENWSNAPWPNPHFSRQLTILTHTIADGSVAKEIVDPSCPDCQILGMKRVAE